MPFCRTGRRLARAMRPSHPANEGGRLRARPTGDALARSWTHRDRQRPSSMEALRVGTEPTEARRRRIETLYGALLRELEVADELEDAAYLRRAAIELRKWL